MKKWRVYNRVILAMGSLSLLASVLSAGRKWL
jgi:hypothetical protein